jgi:hypothetical protein
MTPEGVAAPARKPRRDETVLRGVSETRKMEHPDAADATIKSTTKEATSTGHEASDGSNSSHN